MNRKEQRRLVVLNRVEARKMVGREASEVSGLSLRHVRRLLAAYRKEGAQALAHGNRGRKPHNALDKGLSMKVSELAESTYAGCNNQHLTELLAEREGIALCRSSVRRILLGAGIRINSGNKVTLPQKPAGVVSQTLDSRRSLFLALHTILTNEVYAGTPG